MRKWATCYSSAISLFPKLPPKLSGRRHKHWKIRLSVDWALLTLMHTVIASHYMTNDSHEAAVYTFSVPFRRGHFRALAIDIIRVEIACVAEALSPKQYTHLSSTFSSDIPLLHLCLLFPRSFYSFSEIWQEGTYHERVLLRHLTEICPTRSHNMKTSPLNIMHFHIIRKVGNSSSK